MADRPPMERAADGADEAQTTGLAIAVRIVIDARESREYDALLAQAGCACERQTLSVGDFVLSERLVAERKSRADFESSIIDGRLFEQAQRLVGTYPRVVLIVEGEREENGRMGAEGAARAERNEGDHGGRSGRIDRRALLGAYGALVSDLGISLFFTRQASGTAELLAALARHEQVAKKNPLRVMAKPKSLSIEQYQRAIIESLPGVGPRMARTLLRHFGTPALVLAADETALREVEGMGPKRAKVIRRMLDKLWEEEGRTGEETPE